MKKTLGLIGLVMFVCGIVLENIWRSQSLAHASYDNAGPGYSVAIFGFILLIIGSSGYWKKIFVGIIWFFIFSIITIISSMILSSFIHSDAVIENIFRLMGFGSFILAAWGALTGRLPGTKTQEKIDETI